MTTATRTKARVKFWRDAPDHRSTAWGILVADGKDVFVHASKLPAGVHRLEESAELEIDVYEDIRGLRAKNLVILSQRFAVLKTQRSAPAAAD